MLQGLGLQVRELRLAQCVPWAPFGAMHQALLRPIVVHSIALHQPIVVLHGIAALLILGTARHKRITSEQLQTRLPPPIGPPMAWADNE